MQTPDTSNYMFTLAADLVNNTTQHIFLTGKAGTGKTTFLKYIKAHTKKNAVIVAPTGVAAINAGGVTMHSFFQLPFGPFIPGNKRGFSGDDIADRNTIFKNIRFNADKRDLLQELELLIIDEVSMVRCDMLDAMDVILRHFRKKWALPFGGVQVLYIGDLYQLPPVVQNEEWNILKEYYEGPFFFHSKAVAETSPLYIELKKIYRQNEQQFIDVLNRVRNNQVLKEDLQLLNSRYIMDADSTTGEKYITITTHNYKADAINTTALDRLREDLHSFEAAVKGDFSEKAFPADRLLRLKEGAQVMFIKNDSGADRKYFNGKLATVKKIEGEKITVSFNNDEQELELKKETWRHIRYTLNKATGNIEEEELGSFTQFPVRLAWAITIHKSQGLTFEKAIIDAGSSFAAGQVYVALSRCVSLDGLLLHSKIHTNSISTDERVIAFARREAAADDLQKILAREKPVYVNNALIKLFDWSKTVSVLHEFAAQAPKMKVPDVKVTADLCEDLLQKAKASESVAEKFQRQLTQLLQQQDEGLLKERMKKAIHHFANAIAEDMLKPLQQHIGSLKHASKVKKYIALLEELESFVWQQLQKLLQATYNDMVVCEDAAVYERYQPGAAWPQAASAKEGKPAKGSSQQESLLLYRAGNAVPAIATMRNLAESTIHGHLAAFVRTGALDIHELMTKERIALILPVIKELRDQGITPVREKLGDAFSYAEIRAVMNYWHWLNESTVQTANQPDAG